MQCVCTDIQRTKHLNSLHSLLTHCLRIKRHACVFFFLRPVHYNSSLSLLTSLSRLEWHPADAMLSRPYLRSRREKFVPRRMLWRPISTSTSIRTSCNLSIFLQSTSCFPGEKRYEQVLAFFFSPPSSTISSSSSSSSSSPSSSSSSSSVRSKSKGNASANDVDAACHAMIIMTAMARKNQE